MFSVVGILLLLIAFINYTNMSTTLAIKRTQEMGIRKSLGARQGSMIAQFTIDSLLLSFVSFAIAVLLAHLLIPMINEFTGKQLEFSTLPMKWILLIVACIFLSAIVSSIYPAYTCLRASMVNTMKGGSSQPGQLFSIRKILLVVQFTISIAMIASTFVIYDQLQYLHNKDIGYDVDRLMVIDINSGALRRNVEGIKVEFSKIPEVLNVSTTTRVPGEWKTFAIAEVNKEGNDNGDEMIYMGADQDFLDTYDIQLKKGRNFEVGPADSLKVMLTELAVKQLGLNDPVGQMIENYVCVGAGHVDELNSVFRAEVIGVVEVFHFESLKNEMKPVVIGSPNTVIQ